jgi:foldase protein PrsA
MVVTRMLRLTALSISALAAFAVLAAGCGGGGGGSLGTGIVATVNGHEITQAQLDEVISQAQDRLEAQGQKIPAAGSQEYQSFQQNALQYLVQRTEYEQQADKMGITVSKKEIDERLERVIKQYFGGSEKKYQEALKKQNTTDAQVREELRVSLLEEAVFKKVGESAKVTDSEIIAYYNAHPELYSRAASRSVRHILVTSKTLADDLYARLKGGADFAKLAKKYSIDSSKDVGGKLTDTKGSFVPQFEKVAFSLKTNEIGKPVKSKFGWHIIQALGPVQAGTKTNLKDARTQIESTLKSQKQSEAVTQWLQNLKTEYAKKIKYAPGFAPPTPTTTTGTASG